MSIFTQYRLSNLASIPSLSLALFVAVGLSGCDQRSATPTTPTSAGTTQTSSSDSSATSEKIINVTEDPASVPTSAPASTGLKQIDYTLITYPIGLSVHITVTPSGHLHAVHVLESTPGGLKNSKQDAQGGQLTAAQMSELEALFATWDSLSATYPRFPDGADIQIQYGGKKVDTGGEPKVIGDIQKKLEEFAKPMDHLAEQ